MRYISSGHSHGEQITIIIEGIPSNLSIDIKKINEELKKRQKGYGRGQRMQIEHDQAQILSGVLFGKTTGAPIAVVVKNKDYQFHLQYMEPFAHDLTNYNPIKVPRPGHADLVGAIKYNFRDMRLVFERASARETVSRVVVGAICKQILALLNIETLSYVKNIGGISCKIDFDKTYIEKSLVSMPSKTASEKAMELIDETMLKRDTLGGICQVEVNNVPVGLGSFVTDETKLDAKIASSVMSIQSCKGVEFGDGFELSNYFGSQAHDEISYEDGFTRQSNHYGGFEGGMTSGMPIILKAVFKPIPTLMQPLQSVNIDTKAKTASHIERSDVCVLPAAAIICEHTVAIEITKALITQFTSDTIEQLIDAVFNYQKYTKRF